VSAAWDRLEALAASRVEKSDGTVTQEAAIAAVLKTREGSELYAAHQSEAAVAIEHAGLSPWQPPPDARTVRKAASAADAIDELATKHRARHPALSQEQAVDAVLRTEAGRALYEAHQVAMRGASVRQPESRMEGPGEARDRLRKDERVVLSKQDQQFVDDFKAYLKDLRAVPAFSREVAKVDAAESSLAIWDRIEKLAQGVVAKSGGPWDDAFDAVLQSPAGRQLFRRYVLSSIAENGGRL
jgi:hypothetical protein